MITFGTFVTAKRQRSKGFIDVCQGTRMEIVERTVNDVTILDLKGKMTLGEGDEMLKEKINSLLLPAKRSCCSTWKRCRTSTARVSAKSSGRSRR